MAIELFYHGARSVDNWRSCNVVPGNITRFPGGEVGVRYYFQNVRNDADRGCSIWFSIHARIQTSDDVMALLQTVDAIRVEFPHEAIDLVMPYVPYARQDRVCNEGEALSVRIFARLINTLNFRKVTIVDPHSDVTPALIDRVAVINEIKLLHLFEEQTNNHVSDYVLVCPDRGATKKIEAIAKHFGVSEVVYCDKIRDLATGKIIKTKVPVDEFVSDKKYLVIDDIFDGGRTFIELANAINIGRPLFADKPHLDLFVTHGIFSKGFDEIVKCYTNVYTTDSYRRDISVLAKPYENIRVIDIDY